MGANPGTRWPRRNITLKLLTAAVVAMSDNCVRGDLGPDGVGVDVDALCIACGMEEVVVP